MVQFTNWIWNLFPEYHHQQDSYKDGNGQGLLERYIKNYGQELDQNFIPFIENLLDLIDATKADAKYLPYLAFTLGNPISIDNDIATYRRILQYAVALYKIKGTEKSYQLLFNLIGVDVQILEEMPQGALRYDSGHFYDENPLQHYDQSCENCSYYTIAYGSVYDTTTPILINTIPQDLVDKFANIICFLQPINAKLRGYQKKITFAEEFDLDMEDDITGFNRVATTPFDEGFDTGFDSPDGTIIVGKVKTQSDNFVLTELGDFIKTEN